MSLHVPFIFKKENISTFFKIFIFKRSVLRALQHHNLFASDNKISNQVASAMTLIQF